MFKLIKDVAKLKNVMFGIKSTNEIEIKPHRGHMYFTELSVVSQINSLNFQVKELEKINTALLQHFGVTYKSSNNDLDTTYKIVKLNKLCSYQILNKTSKD